MQTLCAEAREAGFAAVCVAPTFVALAARELAGTEVEVGTVVAFPLGAEAPRAVRAAAEIALDDGARALDLVLARGRWRSGEQQALKKEWSELATLASAVGGHLKLIFETGALTGDEIEAVAVAACEAGVHWLKTCTGFGPRGASLEDLQHFRTAVGDRMPIKASGGLRDLPTVAAFLDAGASRIGTSSGLQILKECAS